MKASELLKKGRELISDPAKWTKGAYARNSNEIDDCGGRVGVHVNAAQPTATCWCSAGALKHFTQEWDPEYGPSHIRNLERSEGWAYHYLLRAVIDLSVFGSVESFNDAPGTTHEKVLQVWDYAIKLAEKNGA